MAEAALSLGVSEDFFAEHVQCELRIVRRGRKKLVAVREQRLFVRGTWPDTRRARSRTRTRLAPPIERRPMKTEPESPSVPSAADTIREALYEAILDEPPQLRGQLLEYLAGLERDLADAHEALELAREYQRTMSVIAYEWRLDWSDFDGRTLMHQERAASERLRAALAAAVPPAEEPE
jgi:hypothetical protein